MTTQQMLIEQIRQDKLREPMLALLRQGISRHTIEACIKHYCKEEGRHTLRRPGDSTTHQRYS
jgi:hypothetical protein